MNTETTAPKKAKKSERRPTKTDSPAPANKLANHFYVEGRKGDQAEEYAHVWAGKEDDPHDRTPEWQRAYAESMLNKCRRIHPTVTFSLIFVDAEGNETDQNL